MHTSPADAPGSGDAGGMNVVERHQAEALAVLGHRVELITRRASPDAPDRLELAPGIILRHVTAGPPHPVAKSAQDAWIPQFREGLAVLGPYDLFHSHHWMSGVAALPVARHWKVPHVQSFHSVAALPDSSLAEGEAPESAARITGEAQVAQNSDLVVAISAAESQTAIQRCGADPDRVVIVPPGVDSQLFHPAQLEATRWSWPGASAGTSSTGYVVFAARLQPLKGPDLALEALAQVPERLRPHLVLAGDVSADHHGYRRELDQLVERLGLSGGVSFVGPQERGRLAWLLRGARLVLVPSHSETFGLIALEAAASGVPVLASDAGGLREVVVDGETGRLLSSRDPRRWGAALTELVSQPDVLARMGTAARARSLGFDWNRAGQRLSALYTEVIDQLPQRRDDAADGLSLRRDDSGRI